MNEWKTKKRLPSEYFHTFHGIYKQKSQYMKIFNEMTDEEQQQKKNNLEI